MDEKLKQKHYDQKRGHDWCLVLISAAVYHNISYHQTRTGRNVLTQETRPIFSLINNSEPFSPFSAIGQTSLQYCMIDTSPRASPPLPFPRSSVYDTLHATPSAARRSRHLQRFHKPHLCHSSPNSRTRHPSLVLSTRNPLGLALRRIAEAPPSISFPNCPPGLPLLSLFTENSLRSK